MKKWIGAIASLCISLSACDSYTTDLEGKWQLKQIEFEGDITQVDTVWYNFQTSLFQYQIYDRATDSYAAVHGYNTYEGETLFLELFQSTQAEKDFLQRTDWSSAKRNFIVEKISNKQLILSDDEKRYIFRKF